jgi:N-acyl-D-aspartate/D-glutamate deacylase
MRFDVIVKNGLVVDGSGSPALRQDVGIREERIESVGDLTSSQASLILNAEGLVVAPGFIDIHSHSEFNLLLNPQAESKVRQGVTTEICGNCGVSPSPLIGDARDHRQDSLSSFGLKIDWSSLEEYRARVHEQGIALNIATLIGQGTVRASVVGYLNRGASQEELSRMKDLLRREMSMGGFGLSLGLVYPPGVYTGIAELIDLANVVREYHGIVTAHIRSEGDRITEALPEMITLGREAEVPIQISHLKTSGEKNWPKLPSIFNLIESAQAQGIDITADRYPYTSSSTDLDAILPAWAFEGGNKEELKRLCDEKSRKRMKEEILQEHPQQDYWERIRIASANSSSHQDWEGMSMAEIAEKVGKFPCDLLFDLLWEERLQVGAIFFSMNETNLKEILKRPYVMIGSDSSVRAHYGVLKKGKPHPRGFGTFPRILGRYVREEKVLTLEQAIYKMTAQPAQRIGIKERGLIREGFYADLTIFDPETIRDTSTYEEPYQYPEGIRYVIVNGKVVLENGETTGILSGKVLLR